jgi:hypothetical protein
VCEDVFRIVGHKYYKEAIMLNVKELNGKSAIRSAD